MSSFFERLPDNIKKFADPNLPKQKRLMAAEGAVPIPPRELAMVLFALFLDDDENVSEAAQNSISSIEEEIMGSILSDRETFPEFIHYISRTTDKEPYLEKIILNPAANDLTIATLAGKITNHYLLDIIANNHIRLMRSEKIFESLSMNPALAHSTLDKIVSFLSLHFGKELKAARPNLNDSEMDIDDNLEEQIDAQLEDESISSFFDDIELNVELSTDDPEDNPEDFSGIDLEELENMADDSESTKKKKSMYALIKAMGIPEKVKLAMLGNKEARYFLAREPIAVITKTLLKNPRITESEILEIVSNPTIDQEIFRLISLEKKWMKNYSVKLTMVNNPKTPTHIGIQLVGHLRKDDVKALLRNKNLPGIISYAARKRWTEIRERVGGG